MISKLFDLVEKDERLVLGLMSGTSADGLDVALVKLRGSGLKIEVDLLKANTFTYEKGIKDRITELYDPRRSTVDKICEMNFLIAEEHAKFVLEFLKKNNMDTEDVDLIAYHGQTIYHLPYGGKYGVRSTLQIGEMDLLAHRTGIMTIGDFRKKDVAARGQGAPLVSYMDYILYKDDKRSVSVHNLGGISNLTYLPRGCSENDVVAFDTGPANALMDAVSEYYFGMPYDDGGKMASKGKINQDLFQNLIELDGGYFKKRPPKTTGKEFYNLDFVLKALGKKLRHKLKPEDVLGTVTYFTAWHLFQNYSIHVIPKGLDVIIFSGGGTENKTLMKYIGEFFKDLKIEVKIDERFGKFKEAVCMAILAHEFLNGKPNNIPKATGAERPVICGKLSFP